MAVHLRDLLKRTYALWRDDHAPQVAAALTYYVLLSLAPLLVVLVGVIGAYLGRTAVTAHVAGQAYAVAGQAGERFVREVVRSATPAGRAISVVATLLALLGAMRVFSELRAALNRMWDVPAEEGPRGTLVERVRWIASHQGRKQLLAFLMVLAVGVLLVASLVASAVVRWLAAAVPPVLPFGPAGAGLLDSLVSIVLVAALFAVVYRVLPQTRIAWRDVGVGAVVSAALFVLGRLALGLYFTYASPGSAYGAAGSLVALLVWINLSLQLALFGAEFTYVWAHEHGSRQDEPEREPAATRSEAAPRAAGGTPRAHTE